MRSRQWICSVALLQVGLRQRGTGLVTYIPRASPWAILNRAANDAALVSWLWNRRNEARTGLRPFRTSRLYSPRPKFALKSEWCESGAADAFPLPVFVALRGEGKRVRWPAFAATAAPASAVRSYFITESATGANPENPS